MELDWRHRLALQMLASGNTLGEAANAAGVHRQSLLRWRWEFPEFKAAVIAARATGSEERRYRAWLHHPFRGCRPPTGKGHGGKPQFTYGSSSRR